LAAAAWLWRKALANGLRQGVTWDCDFATPTARMQYTSGSFAGIATGWFRWILQPERRLRRPRGHFPATAIRLERIPETVLERLLTPASVVILQFSTSVRRLQHGRLQFYILYLVAGLLGLGVLVLLGGMQWL
jgi:hydrogenase-4 component B